jgi:hypothetical protein
VRACGHCNRGFSADEADFRGFTVMANSRGEQPMRDRLFCNEVVRNWRRPEAAGAIRRILDMIHLPEGSSPENPFGATLVPSEKIMRAVRKFVRGLNFHHFTPIRGLPQVLIDDRIEVDPLYGLDVGFLYEMPDWQVIHPQVFGYGFSEEAMVDVPGVDSFWMLDVYRGATFTAVVKSNTFPLMGNAGLGR